jgi:LmbE family N-acetylglucosaminyl deacetylase
VPQARPVETARALARRVLYTRARDLTADIATRSCLVVAPHPDDETIGCGATIARKAAAGTPVTVVVISDGSRSHTSDRVTPTELAAIRRAEAEAAVRALGETVQVRFWDLPDGDLAAHRAELTERLADLVDQVRPADVLSPSVAEPPADHHEVAGAVRDALRRARTGPRLLEYPIWLWSRWPWTGERSTLHRLTDPFTGTLRTPVAKVSTAGVLDHKRAALAEYATQMTRFRGDPDWAPLPRPLVDRALGSHEIFFPVS